MPQYIEEKEVDYLGYGMVPILLLVAFDVLRHDGRNDSISPMENDVFLEMVLVPCYLVLVGEMFVLGDGCQGSDVEVCERRFFHPVAVEILGRWRRGASRFPRG